MIILHHLENSRSQRIVWLLEELGLPYDIKIYKRNPSTMLAPDELKKVHPLGRSPVITDGDAVVAESGAIIEYLLERYGNGRLKPAAGSAEAQRYQFFLHYAEGSVMPPLLVALIFQKIEDQRVPFFIRPITHGLVKKVRKIFINPQLKTNFDYIESELAAHPWFAGNEFSAADIQMSFPVEAAAKRGAVHMPRCLDFLARIHARPAYQRALSRSDGFRVP